MNRVNLGIFINDSNMYIQFTVIYLYHLIWVVGGFLQAFDCFLNGIILNFKTNVREIVRMISILPETGFT